MSIQDQIERLKNKYAAAAPKFIGSKQLILSKRNPEAIIRILTVGEDWFPIIGIHSVTKRSTNNFATYLCPTLTEQEANGLVQHDNCLICEAAAQAITDKDSSKLSPKKRVAIKVIEFIGTEGKNTKGEAVVSYDPAEIKYLIVPIDVGGQLLDYIADNPDIVSPSAGMLIHVSKHYDSQYPTYLFNILKTNSGGVWTIPMTSDRALEFIKNNDIQIDDVLPKATAEDIADIVTEVKVTTEFSPKEDADFNVVNGKPAKTSYDVFMNKITGK